MQVNAVWQNLVFRLRRKRYLAQFTSCGVGFTPKGPMLIRNGGRIIVGVGLITESSAHLPVEIEVSQGATLTIGDHVYFNQGVHISCSVGVTVGDGCLFGREVIVLDNDWHAVGSSPIKKGSIQIGARVWIGTRAMILQGVTLGEGCVVAAGAVVTRSVEAHTLVGGVPAKFIRRVG